MKGTLGYKDAHGRFWAISESTDFTHAKWSALTIDSGHTEEAYHVAADVEILINVIDEEPYKIDTSEPLPPTTETVAEGNDEPA